LLPPTLRSPHIEYFIRQNKKWQNYLIHVKQTIVSLKEGDLLAPRRQERQVTGQGPSSRANARDLGKISPFGRNDKRFAPLREIFRVLVAALPR
jgi:hypothetical protein